MGDEEVLNDSTKKLINDQDTNDRPDVADVEEAEADGDGE